MPRKKRAPKKPAAIRGILFLHSETGTEGGHWALQDERFISPPKPGFPNGSWSYEGLHCLRDGDRLTIFDKADPAKVVWKGVIRLKQHRLFTEHARGPWIHADQEGIDRDAWAEWFFKEYPAELRPAP